MEDFNAYRMALFGSSDQNVHFGTFFMEFASSL